jgi:hypothetical protein
MKERTMQRTLILAAVAALALAAAPAASAKEITKAEVCGADGCAAAAGGDRQTLGNGGPTRTPPAAAPFYTLRITVDHGDGATTSWEMTAVPARRALRAEDGTWLDMPPDVAAVITKLAAGHRPFPASALTGAAPAPKPRPAAAADAGSALWPEAVLIALALAVGGGFVVRAARGSRRFRPASS